MGGSTYGYIHEKRFNEILHTKELYKNEMLENSVVQLSIVNVTNELELIKLDQTKLLQLLF